MQQVSLWPVRILKDIQTCAWGRTVAQCSEELVITKVEDTNEMTLDRNEDYNGMTEVDGSE